MARLNSKTSSERSARRGSGWFPSRCSKRASISRASTRRRMTGSMSRNRMRSPSVPDMKLTLIQHGQTSYVISIGKPASEPERFAAEELRRYLEKIGGTRISIQVNAGGQRVIILDANLKAKSPDAFTIRTIGPKLVLSGASPRAGLFEIGRASC